MCDVYISVVGLINKYWLIRRQDYVISGFVKIEVILLFGESVSFDVWGKEITLTIMFDSAANEISASDKVFS